MEVRSVFGSIIGELQDFERAELRIQRRHEGSGVSEAISLARLASSNRR